MKGGDPTKGTDPTNGTDPTKGTDTTKGTDPMKAVVSIGGVPIRKFGLIGYPLTHSFSQRYFTEKFAREGIAGCSYAVFPLPDIQGLGGLLTDGALRGLNVTIPYKEQVLPFLNTRDAIVQEINACNCIRIGDSILAGYNTDVIGFEQSLIKKLQAHHTRALILGTGGAAKAVEYVMRKLGIAYRYVSRTPGAVASLGVGVGAGVGTASGISSVARLSYAQVDAALLGEYTLIVNTTPLGMYPNVEECPPLPYEAITPRHYLFDLVYNPGRTLFLQQGAERGALVENGYEMLILQAEESWRIWNE